MTMVPLSNAKLRAIVKLHQKKFRDAEGLFLAEGLRTVQELCNNLPNPEMLIALLIRENDVERAQFAAAYRNKVFSVTDKECAQLADTFTPPGIFGVFRQQQPPMGDAALQSGRSLIIALDDVQDPGNVGTILRTAAWFGADAIMCSKGTVDRYNPKVVRSCAGSIFALPHYGVESLSQELRSVKKRGYSILCTTLDGTDFRNITAWPPKAVLVIGNEANGISQSVKALANQLVRIPHIGAQTKVESLNAAVSAAILMERVLLG